MEFITFVYVALLIMCYWLFKYFAMGVNVALFAYIFKTIKEGKQDNGQGKSQAKV